jgi:hypothetical protein
MHCGRRRNGARELALYRQIQGEGNAGGLAGFPRRMRS